MVFSSTPSGNQEARAARKARTTATAITPEQSTKHSSSIYGGVFGLTLLLGAVGYGVNDIVSNPTGSLGAAYNGSFIDTNLRAIYTATLGHFDDINEPITDKILPDWPTAPCYANIAPGTPCPPTLIVDLEKTLMHSVYDVKHGWRHVRRPGYDKFIKAATDHFEVVIFSEYDLGVVQEILESINPEHTCFPVGRDSGELRNGKVLKRIDCMNRDPRRILVIDDNPESVELCMANTLLVAPFDDVNNVNDRTLEDLIPLLDAFLYEDSPNDFRETIQVLGTHDSKKAAINLPLLQTRILIAQALKQNAQQSPDSKSTVGVILLKQDKSP